MLRNLPAREHPLAFLLQQACPGDLSQLVRACSALSWDSWVCKGYALTILVPPDPTLLFLFNAVHKES